MKKFLILVFTVFLLVGCTSRQKDTTFMITKDQKTYTLYNQDGKKLSETSYKTYKEMSGLGYVVTDQQDQVGFISYKGKEIIPFGEYKTLEIVDEMLYATKEETQDATKETIVHQNLYILSNEGDILYTADNQTGIIKSGLPIIVKDNKYTVLYRDGEEFKSLDREITYANEYQDGDFVVIGDGKTSTFYDCSNENEEKEFDIAYQGQFKIMAIDSALNRSAILYDTSLKSMIYVNREVSHVTQVNITMKEAYFDEGNNIILKNDNITYLYQDGEKPKQMNSYYMSASTYLLRSSDIYGPHSIYKNNEKVGELTNCQIYPMSQLVLSEIYPVYVRNEGFKYYNFDNKQVIDQTYIEAEPFDMNSRAIVKVDEKGYSLIDNEGNVLTSQYYAQIKYIGSHYYAVYNEDGRFGIIGIDGVELLPIEYTELSDEPLFTYQDTQYMLLGKNGRTHVYELGDEINEVLSIEGQLVFNKKGYFVSDNQYYTFEGKVIE